MENIQQNQEQGQGQKPKIPNVDNYVDTEGITTKKLNFGLWYVEHAARIKAGLVVFFSIIIGAFCLYAIYGFYDYIIYGMKEDQALLDDLANTGFINQNYLMQSAPKNLAVGQVQILRSDDKADLLALISNPNPKHLGEFDYAFVSGGTEVEKGKGFVLPGESKNLMSLGKELKTPSAQIVIENLKWQKINAHEIKDWDDFRSSHLNIAVSDIQFNSGGETGLNSLSFKAANNTAYNYWQVNFLITLHNGGRIIGVNKYGLAEFMSGDRKDINMIWAGALPGASQIMITPEVNIMDAGSYIKVEGGIGEVK